MKTKVSHETKENCYLLPQLSSYELGLNKLAFNLRLSEKKLFFSLYLIENEVQ